MPALSPRARISSQSGHRIGGGGEDLVAALAGIAGPRDQHRPAEERGRSLVEITQRRQVDRGVRVEEAQRRRPLQRDVVQVVVEGDARIPPPGAFLQPLQTGARAMDHEEVVVCEFEDDGVVADAAVVLQDGSVGRAPDRDPAHVAGDDVVCDGGGIAPPQMHLLESRDIEQAGPLPHGVVLVAGVAVVGPRRAHAVPVLEVRAERPMVRGQRRFTFAHGQSPFSYPSIAGRSLVNLIPQSPGARCSLSAPGGGEGWGEVGK